MFRRVPFSDVSLSLPKKTIGFGKVWERQVEESNPWRWNQYWCSTDKSLLWKPQLSLLHFPWSRFLSSPIIPVILPEFYLWYSAFVFFVQMQCVYLVMGQISHKMKSSASKWVLGQKVILHPTSGDYDLVVCETPAGAQGPPRHMCIANTKRLLWSSKANLGFL